MAMVHIYDNTPSTSWGMDNSVASGANARSEDRIKKPVINVSEMRQALDDLLKANTRVDQLLVETHGAAGLIGIGPDVIDHTVVESWFGSRGYERLFASSARVLFNGCNVAEGANGWRFLETFGTVLLKLNGGQVTGWTSMGSSNPYNGHVVHFWGNSRVLIFSPGGNIIERIEH